jgi:hypothetical protein
VVLCAVEFLSVYVTIKELKAIVKGAKVFCIIHAITVEEKSFDLRAINRANGCDQGWSTMASKNRPWLVDNKGRY